MITPSTLQQNLLSLCIVGALVCTLVFLSAPRAHAQFQLPGNEGASLEVDPKYPGPNESVTIRFADYSQSSNGAGLSWYVDGTHVVGSDNQSTLQVTTSPTLGKPTTVEARLASSIGLNKTAKTILIPNTVDIITESNTTAPYFYKGRRVPSVGSYAHFVAVPHFYTALGTLIRPPDIIYTWNVNNTIAKQAKGDPTFDMTLSSLGDSLVMLTLESSDNKSRLETTFSIPIAEPSLLFYPYNALTGLSRNAIADNYLRAEKEASVRAEPYFMSNTIYQNAQYGWTLGGSAIQNQNKDPQMITLQKSGDGGVSDISFSIRNLSSLSQFAQNLFRLEL